MHSFSSSHQTILDAAQTWAESCLRDDNSIFTDKSLWTPEILSEFAELFTDNPNWEEGLNFTQKLEKQLVEGTTEVKQLAAELLWLLFLFPTRFSAEKKEECIRNVWKWSGQDIPTSSALEIAYEPAIGFPGTAFNTQRWREINFLLSTAIEFKKLEQPQRATFLSEPWEFAAWLDKVEDAGKRQMRHILLHLLFPQNFERIATFSHKNKIISALTSKETVSFPEDPEDLSQAAQLDWKLQTIRSHFAAKLGQDDLDFYEPPLSSIWGWGGLTKQKLVERFSNAIESNRELLWNRFKGLATDFEDFANPGEVLQEKELNYKQKSLSLFCDGFEQLEIEGEPNEEQANAMLELWKQANTNIVNFRNWDLTFGTESQVITKSVTILWKLANDEISLAEFFQQHKKLKLKGRWDCLSFSLWCLAPDRFFPIKISFYRRLAEELGTPFDKKRESANEKSFIEVMSFGEAFRKFLSPSNPRDMTDVQSFMWVCSPIYAAPFQRLFPRREAEQVLNDASAVVESLEDTEGFNENLLSITITDLNRGSGIRMSINYGNWLVFHYSPYWKAGYKLALRKEGMFKEQLLNKENFKEESPKGPFCSAHFEFEEYEDMSDELWDSYLADLPLAVETFANWSGSPYRRHHLEELHSLIMNEEERARLLKEGLSISAEQESELSDLDSEETTQTNPPYSEELALEELFLSKNQFTDILAMLKAKKNIILQGPPGVGKTFIARRLAYALMEEKDEDRAPMIQFHQSYSYEDFIQGYRPDGEGGFELRNGIFYELCRTAQKNPNQDYFLVIDEINRGNLSKIFGELLMLIEADKRDSSLALQLTHTKNPNDKFFVPENIHLIGTMNTADRSLSVVDYALRRRFAFISLEAEFRSPKFTSFLSQQGVPESKIKLLVQALSNLNDTIEKDKSLGNGFSIGHSFFCPPADLADFKDWYRKVVKFEVEPLLAEYWLDATEKVEEEVNTLLQIIE